MSMLRGLGDWTHRQTDRNAVQCWLLVPLRDFVCLLWVFLRSSRPYPLGFLSIFGHVCGTSCIGRMFCIPLLMVFENACRGNGPMLVQRTSSTVLLVHRILLFRVDWKWFLLCQVVKMALCWSHAILWGHVMLTTLGALLRYTECLMCLEIVLLIFTIILMGMLRRICRCQK